ncbi:MAG: cytochrome c [Flavobacteriales bacterium]|nr:cytochrome c [Flavobacteriales bacterium]
MNQALLILLLGIFYACGNVNSQDSSSDSGKQIYKTYCVACHGANGKLKLNEASDLTLSEMTLQERIKNITEGGSMMPAFGEVISKEQIAAVAVYLDELKESN